MKRKVTEKNAATIMGFINNFLRKNTKSYEGMQQFPIDFKTISVDGDDIKLPLWSNPTPFYQPVLHAKCTWHHYYKNNDDVLHSHDSRFPKVLLAISNPFESSCLPIYEGNFIEIKGNVLLVYHNTECIMKDKSTRIYMFIHDKISEDEHDAYIVQSVYNMFAEDMYNEEVEWCGYDEIWTHSFEDIVNYTRTEIEKMLQTIMTHVKGERHDILNINFKELLREPSCNNGSIYIDMDKVSEKGLCDDYCIFYINDEKATVQSLNHFAIYVYCPLISIYDENISNDEDVHEFDWCDTEYGVDEEGR